MKSLLDHRRTRRAVRRALDAAMVIAGLGVGVGSIVVLAHGAL